MVIPDGEVELGCVNSPEDDAAGTAPSVYGSLAAVAKGIGDLGDLVRMLAGSLSQAKPWQRQLRVRLAEAQQLLEVLRLTVAMERSDVEILEAANLLAKECNAIVLAIVGSRADVTTKAAVRLVSRLAQQICDELRATAP